ncbi:hypothetical protein TNCV_1329711 [Trichonephila clavipes]|nr:hypothetical protein TNCV_1329711 [Trichonephila clavipes]
MESFISLSLQVTGENAWQNADNKILGLEINRPVFTSLKSGLSGPRATPDYGGGGVMVRIFRVKCLPSHPERIKRWLKRSLRVLAVGKKSGNNITLRKNPGLARDVGVYVTPLVTNLWSACHVSSSPSTTEDPHVERLSELKTFPLALLFGEGASSGVIFST